MGGQGNGQGDGQGGMSGTSEWSAGPSEGTGNGTGGPGHGQGHRDTSAGGPTGTVKTRVDNPAGSKGPIIASRYIKGDQIKGEATKKELANAVAEAKDAAAQAVNDNQIPKKYEGPIKKYFGQFDSTSQPAK